MKRKRFRLIHTACRKCGKPVTTGSRSLYGFDKEKARLDRICGECITGEEHQEILSLVPGRKKTGNRWKDAPRAMLDKQEFGRKMAKLRDGE